MTALTFSPRARKRLTATGGRIREWKSLDGRYIVYEITSPYFGRWYRAGRVLTTGVTFASEARHRTKQAAIRACEQHRRS